MIEKTAIDALKIAREALKERRAYCEQWEYKYADEWDNEDGYIQDAIDKLAALEAEKPSEDAEITRAFSILEAYGVPRGRAKTVSNGIDVLATRYRKDRNGFEGEKQSYAESYHAEQCKACRKDRQPLPEAPRV